MEGEKNKMESGDLVKWKGSNNTDEMKMKYVIEVENSENENGNMEKMIDSGIDGDHSHQNDDDPNDSGSWLCRSVVKENETCIYRFALVERDVCKKT